MPLGSLMLWLYAAAVVYITWLLYRDGYDSWTVSIGVLLTLLTVAAALGW